MRNVLSIVPNFGAQKRHIDDLRGIPWTSSWPSFDCSGSTPQKKKFGGDRHSLWAQNGPKKPGYKKL